MLETLEIMKTKLMQFLSVSCLLITASCSYGAVQSGERSPEQVSNQGVVSNVQEEGTIETVKANAFIRMAIRLSRNPHMTENDFRTMEEDLKGYQAWLDDPRNVKPDEDSFFYEFPRDVDQKLLKELAEVTRDYLNKIEVEHAKEEEAQRTKKANAFLKNMAVIFACNPHIGRDDLIAMVQDTREYLRVWQKDPQRPTVCSDNFLAELEGHPDIKLVQKLRDISLDRLSKMEISCSDEEE